MHLSMDLIPEPNFCFWKLAFRGACQETERYIEKVVWNPWVITVKDRNRQMTLTGEIIYCTSFKGIIGICEKK